MWYYPLGMLDFLQKWLLCILPVLAVWYPMAPLFCFMGGSCCFVDSLVGMPFKALSTTQRDNIAFLSFSPHNFHIIIGRLHSIVVWSQKDTHYLIPFSRYYHILDTVQTKTRMPSYIPVTFSTHKCVLNKVWFSLFMQCTWLWYDHSSSRSKEASCCDHAIMPQDPANYSNIQIE